MNCGLKLCNHCFKSLPRNEENEVLVCMEINSNDSIEFELSREDEGLVEPYDIEENSSTDDVDFTHDDIIDEFDRSNIAGEELINNNVNYIDEYPDDYDNDDDEGENEEYNCTIPTTNANLHAKKVTSEDRNWLIRTNGHVLLNQTGKLLTRRNHNMNSNKTQKHFIQSIASTVPGNCIPLLYPEGMMFPSIFWKMLHDGTIVGAMPSSLMNQQHVNTRAFALHKDVYRSRLTSPHCQSGTNF